MAHSIASLALLVRDYDEAIAFFTGALRFTLLEDAPLGGGKRWVRVAPPGPDGVSLLLARAATPEQAARVGDQTGGRVFLFLDTADFWGDYNHMQAHGVRFTEQPRHEPYGWVVVFLDLYGNKWDLVERSAAPRPDPIAVVTYFNDALNAHDADAMMRLMTADCVFENTFPPPDGARYEGQAAVRGFWESFFAGSGGARIEIEELHVMGERCVMRWRYSWVDSDGQPGHIRGVDIYTLRDGLIAEKLSYVKG
jgi:lactoylglutathione lyase